MSTDRAGRAVRGALAGSLTTFLALAFHVFGGGAAPDGIAIAGSLLATVWICTMLAGRQMRAWLLVVSITVAQVVLHTVFAVATASTIAPVGGHGAHQHGEVVLSSIAHGGHAMWAAHAAAGLVTVLGILFGDRVLTGLVETGARVVSRLLTAVAAPVPVSPGRVALPIAPIIVTIADRAVGLLARRGPPALLTV